MYTNQTSVKVAEIMGDVCCYINYTSSEEEILNDIQQTKCWFNTCTTWSLELKGLLQSNILAVSGHSIMNIIKAIMHHSMLWHFKDLFKKRQKQGLTCTWSFKASKTRIVDLKYTRHLTTAVNQIMKASQLHKHTCREAAINSLP